MKSARFQTKHTTRHAQKQSVDASGPEKMLPSFEVIFVELQFEIALSSKLKKYIFLSFETL